jgi:Glycosyl hydrolase catalytic core
MNNKIKSFVLKKGFMVTMAIENDGTGKSKNYIASETDLVINSLPVALRNSISFIRVTPWNWVNKRGRTDDGISIGTDLTSTWRYRWSNTHNSTLDWEYAPMAWTFTGANDAADITLYINKYKSTHIMSFNESDSCEGQAGQYPSGPTQYKLCNPDVAVTYHKNLMKTGMRIVSPGCREEAPFGWLEEFNIKCAAQDVRIDVIAVHWYDWGAVLDSNTSNDTGLSAFNRFKSYLTNVYNLYGLPIWITEFNANPARSAAVNLDFMNLALPYLESLSYVERYNWFADSDGIDSNSFYVGTSTTLTPLGNAYVNQVSTPSIATNTVNINNNLTLTSCQNCN